MTKKSFLLALFISLIFMIGWELFWRAKDYPPDQEENGGLWAMTRAKIDRLDSTGVVVLGSSRVHFNFQLDVWEEVTANRPLQLAAGGKTPSPYFQDIVENSDYNGTLVIGVAPPLFFSPPADFSPMWKSSMEFLDYYYNRTYAQRLSQFLSVPLNNWLVFVGDEESDCVLKSLINDIPLPARIPSENHPAFPFFAYQDADRNIYMWERMETDTAYARKVKDVWSFFITQFAPPPSFWLDEQPCTLDFFESMVLKFRKKGGKVIFVRSPAYGVYTEWESTVTPRELFWDSLLTLTGCPGYHFLDHEFMNKYELPEWSHMSVPQAREFTHNLVTKMVQDGVLEVRK